MEPTEYKLWKDLEERFKFFLLLAALCGCGYLAWSQFLYIVFMLIFSGIAATSAPLYYVAKDKQKNLSNLDESELAKVLKALHDAQRLITNFSNENPGILSKLPYSESTEQLLNQNQQISLSLYQNRKQERERLERDRVQQHQAWKEYVEQKRRARNLQHGAPPDSNTNSCPPGYPIRATENLTGSRYRDEKYRGIYYQPGDPDYNSTASWCFESVEHAKADGFRESRRRRR